MDREPLSTLGNERVRQFGECRATEKNQRFESVRYHIATITGLAAVAGVIQVAVGLIIAVFSGITGMDPLTGAELMASGLVFAIGGNYVAGRLLPEGF